MTFKEFQKTRRLCTDEDAHPWEGDLDFSYQPRFHYTAGEVSLSIRISDNVFDIAYQGYPHLDNFHSLEDAERATWNHALGESWGIDGEKEPVRRVVKLDQLVKRPEQKQFVDMDEMLDAIKWTQLLEQLHGWSIYAMLLDGGNVELYGDEDQIENFLLENPVQ